MTNSVFPQSSPRRAGSISSSDKLMPWQQMLQILKQLCQARRTGSLYFVSTEQHAGNFALYQGRIVGVRYACQREERALAALQNMTQVSYRFLEKNISMTEFQALPETYDILAQLDHSSAQATNSVTGQATEPAAAQSQATAIATARTPAQDAAQVNGLGDDRVQPVTEVLSKPESANPFFSSRLPDELVQDERVQHDSHPEHQPPVKPNLNEPAQTQSSIPPQTAETKIVAPESVAPEAVAPGAITPEPVVQKPILTERAMPESMGEAIASVPLPATQPLRFPPISDQATLTDPAQQLALEHLAKGYLGPVASLIMRKQLRQTNKAMAIIQQIKQRIRDPREAQRFEREARELC